MPICSVEKNGNTVHLRVADALALDDLQLIRDALDLGPGGADPSDETAPGGRVPR